MARRIDFYDDPSGPEANSLVPSVNVVVTNSAGEVLLIRRSDNDNWAVPGGAIDLGESLVQAAVRETREETGIDCEVTGIVGIYTDPRHVLLYTSNGEARDRYRYVAWRRLVQLSLRGQLAATGEAGRAGGAAAVFAHRLPQICLEGGEPVAFGGRQVGSFGH